MISCVVPWGKQQKATSQSSIAAADSYAYNILIVLDYRQYSRETAVYVLVYRSQTDLFDNIFNMIINDCSWSERSKKDVRWKKIGGTYVTK